MRRASGLAWFLLTCLALPVLAEPLTESKEPDPLQLTKAAIAQSKAIEEHIRRGEWDEAARGARHAILVDLGADNGDQISDAVAYLALTDEGQGRHEDAVWHWREALSLGTAVDPTAFGEAGAALAKITLRQVDEAPADLPVRKDPAAGSAVTPPRKVSGDDPKLPVSRKSYPRGIHVQAILDAEGQVRQPVVVSTTYPALAYVVLEAMRGWRFDPARVNSQPVASFYELQIPTPRPFEQVVDFAKSPLAEPLGLLKSGRYGDAEKKVERIWRRGLNENEQSSAFLGVAMTEKALAEAGAGKEDLAICHYQAAQTIEPRLYGADLSAFSAPGALLMQHPWGRVGHGIVPRPLAKPASERTVVDDSATGSGVAKPKIVRQKQPVFPEHARTSRIQGTVIVESVITETGSLRDPLLLRNGPTLGFDASVLDAYCEWRFKPAVFEGKPVKVYYTTTVNFQLR